MDDGQEVADAVQDGIDEQEPLLSGGGSPIAEGDEPLSPSVDMKKTPGVTPVNEESAPPYEEVDLDSAVLRAQGHEASLKRSFSPLAALGLGFRQVDLFIVIVRQVSANGLLKYHELVGWVPQLLRAEPRVWGPTERGVWAPGGHGGSMDHHPRAF